MKRSVPRVFIFPEGTRARTAGASVPAETFRFACDLEGDAYSDYCDQRHARGCWESRKDLSVAQVRATVLEPVDIAAMKPRSASKMDLMPDVQRRISEARKRHDPFKGS